MKKMIKNIIDKIVEFFKSQTRETNIKIAAIATVLILIVVVLALALGKDNALFPNREWEGFFPHKEEVTTTEPEVETTSAEITNSNTFDPANAGEWDDIP